MSNNRNFWGEPDDIEPLPDWMKPGPRGVSSGRRPGKTLIQVIEEALKKPAIPIVIKEPGDIS